METKSKKWSFSRWKIVEIALFAIGIALLAWFAIGQFVAQVNLYGFYSDFRLIPDVSMIGMAGIGFVAVGFVMLTIAN